MPTPADLAKSNSEHAHQRAVFAWANMAAHFGFEAAWDDRSYTVAGYAKATYNAPVPVLSRLFAIANGGARGDDARSKMIRGAQLKAEGVKKGVPDIMLPAPICNEVTKWDKSEAIRYCGLLIEMKRPTTEAQRKGSTSAEQDDWIAYLRTAGYAVSVCFDWQSACRDLQSYIEAGRLTSNGVQSNASADANGALSTV
jgi:hypothetical protein